MNLSEIFRSPNAIGQSEYRVLYESLDDALKELASENYDYTDDEKFAHLIGILTEFQSHAESMRRRLKVFWRQRSIQ